jgi:hypothetical protein
VPQTLRASLVLTATPTALVVVARCSGFRGRVHVYDVRVTTPRPDSLRRAACPAPRVLPPLSPLEQQVVTHAKVGSSDAVTLVTHVSVDRLPGLHALASTWEGPLAAIVYIPCCPDIPSRVRNFLAHGQYVTFFSNTPPPPSSHPHTYLPLTPDSHSLWADSLHQEEAARGGPGGGHVGLDRGGRVARIRGGRVPNQVYTLYFIYFHTYTV